MKKNSKILICNFSIFFCCLAKLNAQVSESDSLQTDIYDITTPETVNLTDTTTFNFSETVKTSSPYQQTEVIRIYSGRHEGNNVIKRVEVPLPESRQHEQGIYIPR